MQTKEQKRKKREKVLKILGALIGVFLLVGCCSVGGLMFLGSDENAPAPTVVATAAPTATTTPTLAPTEAPTATPTPTVTPEATEPPNQTENEAVLGYVDTISPLLERYIEAFTTMGSTFASMRFTSSGDFDPVWKAEVTVALTEMLIVGSEIRGMSPPPCLEKVHSRLVEATLHYDKACSLIAEGIDSLDLDLLERGVEEVLLGTEALNEGSAELDTNPCGLY